MRESFLHFLWRTRRFDHHKLHTTEGLPIEILHPGEMNTDAGPDFFNARLRLHDTVWAGNVEMHLRSSEWITHGHDHDPAYDNVVLHVVWEEDIPILRANGERIPCMELKGRVTDRILAYYEQIEHEQAWIPCQSFFAQVPDIVRLNWMDRVLVERLEQKTDAITIALEQTGQHWEEAFYRTLARNFGLKVNAEPFEALARALPLHLLAKHKNNLLQVEALLFGQAGFLEEKFEEEYPNLLAREYRHLRGKYELTPLSASQWKFLRLRPANFPTVRLAQFAALVHQSAHLFSKILESNSLRELENLFSVQASPYWDTHFQLDKATAKRQKTLGRDFVHLIVINTIIPFLFLYGKLKDNEAYQKRALALLEELPAETNALLDGWLALGQKCSNAYQTQSLIHLKTRYCDAKRCMECAVGNAILK